MPHPPAHVLGAAIRVSWQDASRSLTDMIFDGVSAALHDAGVGIAAVDSVVLASHDLIDGRSLSSMVTAPAAGAYLRDEIRLSEDGLTALSLACARIEANEAQTSIVAAWGRASEGGFMPVARASMDPFMEQPFGLSDMDVAAFRLARWSAVHGDGGEARRRAARLRLERAARGAGPDRLRPARLADGTQAVRPNPPLRADEGPVWADVMVAMIVGARPSRARVAGLGHGTDLPRIGDRDLLRMPALATAASSAMAQAGAGFADLDHLQLDGMTLSDEAIALEAIGACAPGDGFRAYAEPRVNPGGGAAAGWCYPAMGLLRAAEAFLALRDAGSPGRTRRALATGLGGNGGQTGAAVVLEVQ